MKVCELLIEADRKAQLTQLVQKIVAYLKKNPKERSSILRPLVNAHREKATTGKQNETTRTQ